MEIALSSLCGPDDVITPISLKDEEARVALGYRGAQNFEQGFFNHIPASALKQSIPADIWSGYYKFCFERNPWDKVVSWYYWEVKNGRPMSVDQFIQSGHFALVGGEGGFDLYTDSQQQLLVDQVYRYEEMQDALIDIAEKLSVPALPELPRAKSEFRDNKESYKAFFTGSQSRTVKRAFQREIEQFGYKY